MVIAGAVLVGMVSLGGCATKKYVNEQVGVVSAHVAEQDTKIQALDQNTREALQRADAAGKLAEGKFVYSMVLSDDSMKFPAGKATLSPEATARLDAFVSKLKTDNRNVYIEVQGHTDGKEAAGKANYTLGEQRAEAVRRYLNRQGVALNRIGTISYGADAPAGPNDTKAGREANRRVVLVVLA
jgi:outer membrane protein OmpA-like peptidoglycan-associated protein